MKRFQLRTTISLFSVFFQAIAFAVSVACFAADQLPPIDAHRFDVKPIQKSTSGKIYLFESNQVIPKTGNLILVYEQEKPAMAFRVLKNDQIKKTFVGKRVRRYDQTNELKINNSYSSLEKLADALPPPSTASTEESLDQAPVAPIPAPIVSPEATPEPTPEPALEPQDSELDSSSTAALDKIDESTVEEADEEEDEDLVPMEIEESVRMDPYNNILSVSAGYVANASNFAGSSVLNNGFGVSYAHVLFHDVFINRKSPQDSLAMELGGYTYRIINKDGGNDIYSMLPFFGNLLYQLHTSPSFSLNFYGGIQYNYMTSAINAGRSLKSLQGLQPNFGLGMFYTIGPQWFIRADIGWDRITGGLSIKW